MTKNIDKKKYVKPSMKVFPLNSKPQLLQSSLPTGPGWPGGNPW